ncbi:MAG: hypothetical protein QW197_00875 [Candidatus Aenigmatarchaeota archaeon]
MDRIIELLKKGYLVRDSKYILSLSDDEFKLLLNSLPKSQEPKVLEKNEIEKILREAKKKIYKISMIFPTLHTEIKIIEYIEIIKRRYEKLSEIIKNDVLFLNPISINKISKRFKTFSIIGILYSVRDEKIVIEDLSSRVEVKLSEKAKSYLKYLREDIVIGAKCFFEDSQIVFEEIFFPEFKQKDFEKVSKQNSNLDLKIGFFTEKIESEDKGDVNIFLADENKVEENTIYLDRKIPIHRFFIEDFFFVAIDSNKIGFDLDFFLKTRLITPKFEEFVKYKDDMALLLQLPNVFIVYNSNKDRANFVDTNPLMIEIPKNLKNCLIDFKEKKIYNREE